MDVQLDTDVREPKPWNAASETDERNHSMWERGSAALREKPTATQYIQLITNLISPNTYLLLHRGEI